MTSSMERRHTATCTFIPLYFSNCQGTLPMNKLSVHNRYIYLSSGELCAGNRYSALFYYSVPLVIPIQRYNAINEVW